MIDPAPDSSRRERLDHLSSVERERLRLAGALITEAARVRPRYFDGRFLAAEDLQRDQDFFFDRQRELAALAGSGVLSGLSVTQSGHDEVSIAPGVGITQSGELVVIPDLGATTRTPDPLRVRLSDLPAMQALSVELGVLDAPTALARRPTGLFVLALRAVRYTANPQGGYPASVTERRVVEDGDVIEAAAVTLVPYPDTFADAAPAAQRALIARSLFLKPPAAVIPADVVPLAMLLLEAGSIRWLDVHLVRRELGAEPFAASRAGLRSRAHHEAFALQYQAHLDDELAARTLDGLSHRFAASQVFAALPPVGVLPAAAVDLAQGSQLWFPASVQASLAFVPPDEIAQLVAESVVLPPIDLRAGAAQAGLVSVLILSPRERFGAPPLAPVASAPSRRSGAALGSLSDLLRSGFAPPAAAPASGSTPAPAAPESRALLWYVRCRTQHLLPDAVVVEGTGA